LTPTPTHQVYKATANLADAKAMYDSYSAVDEGWVAIREAVLAQKKPRQMFVQPHTAIEGDGVTLTTFEASVAGIIASFQARFPEGHEDAVLAQWETEQAAHAGY